MAGRYTLSMRDFDGDTRQVSYPTTSPAGDGTDYQAWVAGLLTFRDAMLAVSGGNLTVDSQVSNYIVNDSGSASAPSSQAHTRAVIEYKDTVTNKVFNDLDLPVPDLATGSFWTQEGSLTVMDFSDPVASTSKTEFQAHVLSPAGNPTQVLKIYIKE